MATTASPLPVLAPSRSWGRRTFTALFAAGIGIIAVTHAMALMTVRTDQALARRIAPYDGRITAARALALIIAQPTKEQAVAIRLARAALRQEPTAIPALVTLGLATQARGDTPKAAQWFDYAETLSRRNSQTQLWMIENAVANGDVPATLHHYDIALRTAPELATLLYPILATANTDPQISAALVRILAHRPAWGESFDNFLAANTDDPATAARLFIALRQAGVPVPDPARIGTINALVAHGRTNDAWYYYVVDHPGADPRRSRDPRFTATLAPTVFDWTLVNEIGISTTIQQDAKGGVFDFSAPSSVGGVLLRQAQILPPGTYQLSGHSDGIEQADGSRPYWQLTCSNGHEIGRIVMPNSSQDNGTFTGTLQVPESCPVQTLSLVARPSDAIAGLSGRIDRVMLEPIR